MSKALKAYSDSSVSTSVSMSTSNELIVLVFEKIFDYLRIGKIALENNKLAIEEFTKINDLINLGLVASLNREEGGEIAKNLEFIYLWAMNKITEARLTKSHEKIDDVTRVLMPIYESWQLLSKSKY
jgi:flagellar protein FliS